MPSPAIHQPRLDAGAAPFVGRQDQLPRLMRALDRGAPFVVFGPVGIGKTRLMLEALDRSGRAWVHGAASDLLPFQAHLPLVRAFGRSFHDTDPRRVAEEVVDCLADRVLFLDDMQWCDEATMAVLRALPAATRIVIAARPDLDRDDRLVAAIAAESGVLRLGPLDDADVVTLLDRWWPDALPVDRDYLLELADGNPLVAEVVARQGRDATAGADVLVAAVEACLPGDRRLLAQLALSGSAATDGDARTDRLCHAGLLKSDGDHAMASASIFGLLAFELLTADEVVELLSECASESDDLVEKAELWHAAGQRIEAFAAAHAALGGATTRGERSRLLAIAAEAAPASERWRAARDAADAMVAAGRVEEVDRLVERAMTASPWSEEMAAHRDFLQVRVAATRRRSTEVLALTDEALRARLDDRHHVCFLTMRASARARLRDLHGARTDAHVARSIGWLRGEPARAAELVLGGIEFLEGRPGSSDQLRRIFEECLADGEVEHAYEAGVVSMQASAFNGDLAGARAVRDQLIALAIDVDNRRWLRTAELLWALNGPIFALASAPAIATLQRLRCDDAVADRRGITSAILSLAMTDLGDVHDARALVELELDLADDPAVRASLCWSRAECEWLAGDAEACRRAAEDSIAANGPGGYAATHAMVLARWAALDAGSAMERHPEPVVVFESQRGLVAEAQAIELLAAGRNEAAALRFLLAARRHQRLLPRNALRCRWGAGEALRRGGDLDAARPLLGDVLAICEDHGLGGLKVRVEESLRLCGAGARQPRRDDEHLTGRQLEILRLVGKGLSTREIADRLRIAPTTVDSHVRRAMRRTGATTRLAAALLAARPADLHG